MLFRSPQPLVIQCFDEYTLKSLSESTPHIPRVQLLIGPNAVDDSIAYHLGRVITYGPELSLKEISTYAQVRGNLCTKLIRAMLEANTLNLWMGRCLTGDWPGKERVHL